MNIRAACAEDAQAATALIRASIRELCAADHGGDANSIAAWLANKTPASFLRWLDAPGQSLLVAEREGALAGVGLIADAGEVLLLYVDPRSIRRGVGARLLAALEGCAPNAKAITLETTATAAPFYQALGFEADPSGPRRLIRRRGIELV